MGRFMPQTSLRASALILDRLAPDRHKKTVMAALEPVDELDVFSCLEIPQIVSVLDSFKESDDNSEHQAETLTWQVTMENLDIGNLTPSHYIPLEIAGRDYLFSPYPTVKLTDLSEVTRGSSFKLDNEGDLLVVGPAAVRPLLLDTSKLDRTNEKKLRSSPYIIRRNDILLNIISTYRGAAAHLASDLGNAIANRHIIVIRPKSSHVIPEYLAIALNSKYVKQQFDRAPSGAVIPSLNLRTVREVLIPLPDIETQIEIVERIKLMQIEWIDAKSTLSDIESKMDKAVQNLGLQEG